MWTKYDSGKPNVVFSYLKPLNFQSNLLLLSPDWVTVLAISSIELQIFDKWNNSRYTMKTWISHRGNQGTTCSVRLQLGKETTFSVSDLPTGRDDTFTFLPCERLWVQNSPATMQSEILLTNYARLKINKVTTRFSFHVGRLWVQNSPSKWETTRSRGA